MDKSLTDEQVRVCRTCGLTKNKLEYHQNGPGYRCPDCNACAAAQAKKRAQATRMCVLKHYGGNPPKCSCCGELEVTFLCVDHINGGGNAHRRESGCGLGNNFMFWLYKNHYPPGFRVLCWNCNFAVGAFGVCPHDKKRAEAIIEQPTE